MESKDIIEKFFPIVVCLSLHPFVLEEAISALSQACLCLCEISIVWRIEVVEAQVEELGLLIPTRCQKRLSFVSLFTLIEISISRPISRVIMNICIHGCNYFVYMFKLNILYYTLTLYISCLYISLLLRTKCRDKF